MDPEKKDLQDFGKVIDELHSKQKLPSLRTYQGDMAEFIKEKNESVISVTVKEKEREEKREKIEPSEPRKPRGQNSLQVNFTVIFLSLCLVAAGSLAFWYVWNFMQKPPSAPPSINVAIVPYNHKITLANASKATVSIELARLSVDNGVNIIELSDESGEPITKAKEFFNLIGVPTEDSLWRTLRDQFVLGAIAEEKEYAKFLIITVNDFGAAFAGMLEWEQTLEKDLSFIKPALGAEEATNTSTPALTDTFSWKDLIVKNKDTRALADNKNKIKIAYTFLDKNTILIVGDLATISDLASAYASRSVVR